MLESGDKTLKKHKVFAFYIWLSRDAAVRRCRHHHVIIAFDCTSRHRESNEGYTVQVRYLFGKPGEGVCLNWSVSLTGAPLKKNTRIYRPRKKCQDLEETTGNLTTTGVAVAAAVVAVAVTVVHQRAANSVVAETSMGCLAGKCACFPRARSAFKWRTFTFLASVVGS